MKILNRVVVPLDLIDSIIIIDPNNEKISLLLGLLQHLDMPRMEYIPITCNIDYLVTTFWHFIVPSEIFDPTCCSYSLAGYNIF